MPRKNHKARSGPNNWFTTKQKGRNRGRGGAMKSGRKASNQPRKSGKR